jgi:hypothetical protein
MPLHRNLKGRDGSRVPHWSSGVSGGHMTAKREKNGLRPETKSGEGSFNYIGKREA